MYKPLGHIMREEYYSKVIAELIKFMNKMPHEAELYDRVARQTGIHLQTKIQSLIKDIDKYADLDAKGWIK